MALQSGIELYIDRELGANAYKISVYKHKMFVGWLIGYINHMNKTIACYPFRRLERGTFRADELPVRCAVGDIPWERQEEVYRRVEGACDAGRRGAAPYDKSKR